MKDMKDMKGVSPMEMHMDGYAQKSAKTDGMSKGKATGAGGPDGDIIKLGMRGGMELTQMSAKTDGLCK